MPDTPITFGLSTSLIAPWNGDESYGSAIEVPNPVRVTATLRVQSVEGVGGDRIVAAPARVIAGNMAVEMTGVPIGVLEYIYGITAYDFGADATLKRTLALSAGQRLPWWGIVGQGLEEESLGDVLIYAPKCKVTSDIQLSGMAYNEISNLQFTATVLGTAAVPIFYLQYRAATGEYDLPPTNLAA